MQLIQAIILGAVQGLTEFIPVSSSGHLIVIPKLFGWTDMGQSFDVALHMGTLVAVVLFFWQDWISIFKQFFAHIFGNKPYSKPGESGISGQILVPIVVACIPAAFVGWKWDSFIETTLRQWYWVAGSLVLIAFVMLWAERVGKKQREMGQMNYGDYITIGVAQALALFPGVSRSGITISAGLFRGLDRAAAARFSFLLSTPIILGAGLKKLKDTMGTGLPHGEMMPFIVGFITAAIFGYISIKFLMNYLRSRSLNVFIIYRIAFAVMMAVVFLLLK